MFFIYFLYLLICVHVGSATVVTRNYRVSMVSSAQDSRKPAQFLHGESPVWDPQRLCLFFVDVHRQNVHRLDYNTGKIDTKHIEYGQVNVVSLVYGSPRLLVAVRASLYLLDFGVTGDAALRPLTSLDLGHPDNVINEGKPDVFGRLWAGTKGPQTLDEVVPDRASLYVVDQSRLDSPTVALRPVSISNGLAWAPNNSVMYYTDSVTQRVDAFDYDPIKGRISNRRTILDLTAYGYEEAIPDGITIDTHGYLWIAVMFGGAVLHVDPDNQMVLYTYKFPVSRITSVEWGGPKLDELFVTTSKFNVDETAEPLAGAIFTLRSTGYRGRKPNPFRLENPDAY